MKMKELEEPSGFPLKVEDDPYEPERTVEELTDKEKSLLIRLYPFTPNSELCRKFGIDEKGLAKLRADLKLEGVELYKDAAFEKSVIQIKTGTSPDAVKNGSKSHLLANFLNSVSETERRELINFYEERPDAIDLMRQLISIQTSRVGRGGKFERTSVAGLSKATEEAIANLATMITKLEEMEHGQKMIHGIDDSFAGLVMASQRKEDDKWVSGDKKD